MTYPALTRIREVSAIIAEAVAGVAYEKGLTSEAWPEGLGSQVRTAEEAHGTEKSLRRRGGGSNLDG